MHGLSAADAIRLRLAAHGLTGSGDDNGPVGVLDRMVALQGQDLPAVLRATGLRAVTDVDDVMSAFNRGELVRSWPMRGTLFATTPRNLAALLSLTADRVRTSMARRRANLGIDDTMLATAQNVARQVLAAGGVSRSDLLAAWRDAGIEPEGGVGYHLIVHLAIGGLVHWGPFMDGEQLLVASGDAALHPDDADRDALLGRIVHGYLAGRGPATVDDIAWWLKLPKRDITRGIDAAGDQVVDVEVDGRSMLVLAAALDGLSSLPALGGGQVWLLPAFDEYYLGYRDRSLVSTSDVDDLMVPGRNGVFRPCIVVDGRVVGTWRQGRSGPDPTAVADVGAGTRQAVERAFAALA